MNARWLYWIFVAAVAVALVALGAPSWAALGAGLVIAVMTTAAPPRQLKLLTNIALQLGVVALGAGMDLGVVMRVGGTGVLITASSIAIALVVGHLLGKALRVQGHTPLLISIGTAICGGSAIAAAASVLEPEEHETSVALGVVFMLNAVGLVLFPLVGQALGLSQPVFGRWAALAIHDTSSVVGAGLAYGSVALAVATTTKLARALWIAPLTIGIAVARRKRGSLRGVRWPWFILGFIGVAALVTFVPAVAKFGPEIVMVGRRALVLALFLIGLSLSRAALSRVGTRPLLLGVALWLIVAIGSLPLALLPHTS
ncbi:MAG TPA: putative sulfate exporter family transporter [Kofleriaceae bacterium]|nr:putative sulfate exporter family transporter [Kofleriaceae bacterium]